MKKLLTILSVLSLVLISISVAVYFLVISPNLEKQKIELQVIEAQNQVGGQQLQRDIYMDQVRRKALGECSDWYQKGIQAVQDGASVGVHNAQLEAQLSDPNFMNMCVTGTLRKWGY